MRIQVSNIKDKIRIQVWNIKEKMKIRFETLKMKWRFINIEDKWGDRYNTI